MEQKKLVRSRTNRMLAGVSGGLAEYFKVDPLIVRLVFIVLGLINGTGLFIYLLLWLLIPSVDTTAPDAAGQVRENVDDMRDTAARLYGQLIQAIEQLIAQLRGTTVK
ncbi:MAG: PspC domain-containing protein [Chloroflexaceae bacterium]|nr:PspC domain-containing protein [Chloroflexaceae bacterium]NJO06153.1 PspC domain-containing protein [Chloroflexaceae bacterium]